MEQLHLFTTEQRTPQSCAFTGHRELYPGFSARKLKKEIKAMIDRGVTTFYNGMAMGFDLLAAEKVMEWKKSYPQIRLVLCIPCYGQEKRFSEKDKKRYAKLCKVADEKVVLSDEYYRGCMQARNRYMVERADALIAYCIKAEGGAAYTVRCFRKLKPFGAVVLLSDVSPKK